LALLLGSVTGTLLLVRAARRAPPAARFSFVAQLLAAGLIAFWLAIPLLGRMIGYDLAIWGSLSLRT
jgi:hypothetical protein